MKECDILGDHNILWPPTYFQGVRTLSISHMIYVYLISSCQSWAMAWQR